MSEVATGTDRAGRGSRIILFDGVCVLCSAWVRFVLTRDRARMWRFVAMQSPAGRVLSAEHGIDPDDPPTVIVLSGGEAFVRSEAALVVLASLPGYRWAGLALALPRPLRDWVYDRIARNRYRLFGRRETCLVPSPDIRSRFIDRIEDLPG